DPWIRRNVALWTAEKPRHKYRKQEDEEGRQVETQGQSQCCGYQQGNQEPECFFKDQCAGLPQITRSRPRNLRHDVNYVDDWVRVEIWRSSRSSDPSDEAF